MYKIIIKADTLEVTANLNDSQTAKCIYEKLPIKSKIKTWGEEIYFDTPVQATLEEGFKAEIVNMGDLGYWPEGKAFCIFFGPTPASQGTEIRPASAVNVIGNLTGEIDILKNMAKKEYIEVVKA